MSYDDKILVSDFGGAQTKYGSFLNTAKEEGTLFPGTPNYLAPEIQDEDRKNFTMATDIWALGIIYHKMLAKNQTPYNHNKLEISKSIENEHDIKLIERWFSKKF